MPSGLVIASTPAEIGRQVAALIAHGVEQAIAQKRRFVLGCPTGRTPAPVFPALAELCRAGLDVSRITVALMDEYLVGHADDLRLVEPEASFSCVGYATRQILRPLVEAGGAAPELWWADPRDPAEYDRRIEAAGGIDLFLLASGASDGHVAFNPPGSPRDSSTRVIELRDSTRQDNLTTWPELTRLADVPRYGISVGINTIAEHSKQAVMMLTGVDKKMAFRRITAAVGYEPEWPATVVAEIEHHRIFADALAAQA